MKKTMRPFKTPFCEIDAYLSMIFIQNMVRWWDYRPGKRVLEVDKRLCQEIEKAVRHCLFYANLVKSARLTSRMKFAKWE